MTAKLRVLVVESAPHLQPVLVAALGAQAVVASSDPVWALHRAREEPPTVAIVNLPLRDGDDRLVVQALQQGVPGSPLLVVVPRDLALSPMLSPSPATYTQESPITLGQLTRRLALIASAHGGARAWPAPVNPHVLRAAEYLGRHYPRPLTTEEVAREIGLSPGHLAHLFRFESGSTVMRRLRTVRIEVARRLLTDTEDKLDVIARAVGFYDAPHLSRVFQHALGCWPGTYRHRAQAVRRRVQRGRSPVQEQRPAVH